MKWILLITFFIQITICGHVASQTLVSKTSNFTIKESGEEEPEDDLLFLPSEFLANDFKFDDTQILSVKEVSVESGIIDSDDYLLKEFIAEFENAKSYYLIENNTVIMELVDGKKLQFPTSCTSSDQIKFTYKIKNDVSKNNQINISLTK